MIIDIESIFGAYRPNVQKLIAYGFCESDGRYSLDIPLLKGEVTLKAVATKERFESFKLWDNDFGDECILTLGSTLLIEESENALKKLRDCCFYKVVYPYEQACRIHEYMEGKYGIRAEFPWDDENGIYRNPTSEKWFAIIMYVKNKSLGLDGEGHMNCMNVKSDTIQNLLEIKGFQPAYHMNKKHWITMILDNTLPDEVIEKEIDNSFILTTKVPENKI